MAGKVFIALPLASDPEKSFDFFTAEIDLWWKRGPRNRFLGQRPGNLAFVEQSGDVYLIESDQKRPEKSCHIAKAKVWQPGKRIVLEWQWPNTPQEPLTQVNITFAPTPGKENSPLGTRLTVEHLGLEKLSMGHPIRNGLNDNRFKPMMTHFWQAQLVSLRNHINLELLSSGQN